MCPNACCPCIVCESSYISFLLKNSADQNLARYQFDHVDVAILPRPRQTQCRHSVKPLGRFAGATAALYSACWMADAVDPGAPCCREVSTAQRQKTMRLSLAQWGFPQGASREEALGRGGGGAR